jgi:prepilin-type N-terminal cleavage/methylation domain-containing protein
MTLSISFAKVRDTKLSQKGFSLIEMAIVLVILGMLLGGMLMPLLSQREVSQRQATERQLQEIRNAIIGFAQINNRLPCPAVSGTNGIENRIGIGLPNAGNCIATPTPVLPFQALGIQGTVIGGNLVDAWQRPIRYRLTNPNPANNWIFARAIPFPPALPAVDPNRPNFRVCTAFSCAANEITATQVVAVAFSTGPDGPNIPLSTSADQVANLNIATTDFVMRPTTGDARTGFEFDDILVWISQPTLVYELSRAGQ